MNRCIDCLFCKVSAASTGGNRICFCLKSGDKEGDTEAFWLGKTACKKFVDMSDDNRVETESLSEI